MQRPLQQPGSIRPGASGRCAFRALRLPAGMPPRKRPRRVEYEPEAGDTSSGDGWVGNNAARAAGAKLLKHFLSLYAQSKMSAKDLCVACHFAAVAGTPGAQFDMYALGPDHASGHYQRHLDHVLPAPGATYQLEAGYQPPHLCAGSAYSDDRSAARVSRCRSPDGTGGGARCLARAAAGLP